jgi:hypothetical protein
MRRVVHGQADRDYDLDYHHSVECQVPVVDNCDQEEVNQANGKDNQYGDLQAASDEKDDHEDSDNGKTATEYRLFNEHHIKLVVQHVLRVGVGGRDAVLLFDVADVRKVLHSLSSDLLNFLYSDDLSIASDLEVIFTNHSSVDKVGHEAFTLIIGKELVKAVVEVLLGNCKGGLLSEANCAHHRAAAFNRPVEVCCVPHLKRVIHVPPLGATRALLQVKVEVDHPLLTFG